MTTPIRQLPRDLPEPTSVANVITRYRRTLASQVGYREGPNNDTMYGHWFGMNFVAWCHIFVSWGAAAAAVPFTVIPKQAYTPSGYSFFSGKNQDVATPQAGDLGYVYGLVSSEGRRRIHHVFYVESVSGDYVTTLEGNTNNTGSASGNGVYRGRRRWRNGTGKIYFARPNYALAVRKATPKPPASGGGSGGSDTAAKPVVDLSALVYHATYGTGHYNPASSVEMVGMVKLRLIALRMGTAANSFRSCYAAWQRHLGYTGDDANGIPGMASLTVLANNSGWRVVA